MNSFESMPDAEVRELLAERCVALMRETMLPSGEWGPTDNPKISELLSDWDSGNYRVGVEFVDSDDPEFACWDIDMRPKAADASLARRTYNAAVPLEAGKLVQVKPL